MVSKAIATKLMKQWRKMNEKPSIVREGQCSVGELVVSQNEVVDRAPGAASWEMNEIGYVTRRKAKVD